MANPAFTASLSFRPKGQTAQGQQPQQGQHLHTPQSIRWTPQSQDEEDYSDELPDSFSDGDDYEMPHCAESSQGRFKERLEWAAFPVNIEFEDSVSAILQATKGDNCDRLPKYARYSAKKYARLALEYLDEVAESGDDGAEYERMRRMQLAGLRDSAVSYLHEYGRHAPGWDVGERWREGLFGVAADEEQGEKFPEGRMEKQEFEKVKNEIVKAITREGVEEENHGYANMWEQYPESINMSDLDGEDTDFDEERPLDEIALARMIIPDTASAIADLDEDDLVRFDDDLEEDEEETREAVREQAIQLDQALSELQEGLARAESVRYHRMVRAQHHEAIRAREGMARSYTQSGNDEDAMDLD